MAALVPHKTVFIFHEYIAAIDDVNHNPPFPFKKREWCIYICFHQRILLFIKRTTTPGCNKTQCPAGPPNRLTSCRVCVRTLTGSHADVSYRICSQCNLKVCEDCASYSNVDNFIDQVYIKFHNQPRSNSSIDFQLIQRNYISFTGSYNKRDKFDFMFPSKKTFWRCSVCRRRSASVAAPITASSSSTGAGSSTPTAATTTSSSTTPSGSGTTSSSGGRPAPSAVLTQRWSEEKLGSFSNSAPEDYTKRSAGGAAVPPGSAPTSRRRGTSAVLDVNEVRGNHRAFPGLQDQGSSRPGGYGHSAEDVRNASINTVNGGRNSRTEQQQQQQQGITNPAEDVADKDLQDRCFFFLFHNNNLWELKKGSLTIEVDISCDYFY